MQTNKYVLSKNMGLCLLMWCVCCVWWMLNCAIPWCNILGNVFPPIPSVLFFFFFKEKCQLVNGTEVLEEHALFSHFIFVSQRNLHPKILQGFYFSPPLLERRPPGNRGDSKGILNGWLMKVCHPIRISIKISRGRASLNTLTSSG